MDRDNYSQLPDTDCVETTGEDVPDFGRKRGNYDPRKEEISQWGSSIDNFPEDSDQHHVVLHLLVATGPDVEWRESLLHVLADCWSSEADMRRAMAFLHNNVNDGIKSVSSTTGVKVPSASIPARMPASRWISIMQGLRFIVTLADGCYGVSCQRNTDIDALQGFCILLQALLELPWTNLQSVSRLHPDLGRQLYESTDMLSNGFGIEPSHRRTLEHLESSDPALMASLGYRRCDKRNTIQWQRPVEREAEFERLYLVLHGFYRQANRIETVV